MVMLPQRPRRLVVTLTPNTPESTERDPTALSASCRYQSLALMSTVLTSRPRDTGHPYSMISGVDNTIQPPLSPANSIITSVASISLSSTTRTPILSAETGLPHFQFFNKLPLELRNMVWEYSLPGPRVIYVKPTDNKIHDFIIASEIATSKIIVVTTIPGVLHAVQDSRLIALKHYHVLFEGHPRIHPMFFNPDHDYLHTSLQLLDSLFDGPDPEAIREKTLSKVGNLMIGPICPLLPSVLDTHLMKFFMSLKHIIIPRRYQLGDFRRVRHENRGRDYFKNARCDQGGALPGIEVEYKSPEEIMDMSRDMSA